MLSAVVDEGPSLLCVAAAVPPLPHAVKPKGQFFSVILLSDE